MTDKETAMQKEIPSSFLEAILTRCGHGGFDEQETKTQWTQKIKEAWNQYSIDPLTWLVQYQKSRMCARGMETEELLIPDDLIFRFFSKHSGYDYNTIYTQACFEWDKDEFKKQFPHFRIDKPSATQWVAKTTDGDKDVILASLTVDKTTCVSKVVNLEIREPKCFLFFLKEVLESISLVIDVRWLDDQQILDLKYISAIIKATQYEIHKQIIPPKPSLVNDDGQVRDSYFY